MSMDIEFLRSNYKHRRPYRLSYLGERNYIDISSIWQAFTEANKNYFDYRQVKKNYIRIYKPLKNEVFSLSLSPSEVLSPYLRGLTSVEIFYSINSVQYRELLIQGELPIYGRRSEASVNLDTYFEINKNEGRLIKPINEDPYYNFMVLGRAYAEQFMFETPRVASCYAEKIINSNEFHEVRVSLGRITKNFLQIKYSFRKQLLSEILVHRTPNTIVNKFNPNAQLT